MWLRRNPNQVRIHPSGSSDGPWVPVATKESNPDTTSHAGSSSDRGTEGVHARTHCKVSTAYLELRLVPYLSRRRDPVRDDLPLTCNRTSEGEEAKAHRQHRLQAQDPQASKPGLMVAGWVRRKTAEARACALRWTWQ